MKPIIKIAIVLAVFFTGIAAIFIWRSNDDKALADVHALIEREFVAVNHINGDALSALNRKEILLLDIREKQEFAVSHLQGALQIDPDMPIDIFMDKFADLAKGKTVIFYCSVGQRSSSFANKAQAQLLSQGAKAAYNLEGGIFKWHNENRPLYKDDMTPTRYVHAFNSIWGRLVEKQEYARH